MATKRLLLLLLIFVAGSLGLAPAPAASTARWLNPVAPGVRPVILERFDKPENHWSAGHRGVDLAARVGATVYAAGSGEVTFSGIVVDRPVITIDHGDIETTYEPATAKLARGSRVEVGQPIAIVARGGHCSDRCLHWGARSNGDYVDPLGLLGAIAPVLKPPAATSQRPPRRTTAGATRTNEHRNSEQTTALVAVGTGLLALGAVGAGTIGRRRRNPQ